MAFNLNTVSNILLNIAKRHNAHPYSRINTFGIVDSFKQLTLDNLGKDQYDYDNSYYWQRGGYNPDKCADDLRLIMMLRGCKRQAINKKIKCLDVLIGVSQRELCDGCPENQRKGSIAVDNENEDVLFAVIDELRSYRLYKIKESANSEEIQVFATREQVKCWKDEGKILYCKDCGDSIDHKIENRKDIKCSYDCIGDNRIRISWVNLTICGCHVEDQMFDVKTVEDDEFAMIKCDSCL